MVTKLFVGIDGGGTKTLAMVTDEHGTVVGQGEAGPSNYQAVGLEAALFAIRKALSEAMAKAGAAGEPPAAACFGLAGAGRPEDIAALTPALAPLAGRIQVTHDAAIALAGATGGEPGAIVIAGTGSIAYGENGSQSARAGGWGWLMDDCGGGFDVGRWSVQAVMRAHDGTGPSTLLTDLLLGYFGLTGAPQLVGKIYRPLIDRAEMAAVAHLTAEAARASDQVALTIWTRAGHGLAEVANAVLRQLRLERAPVSTVGSLWKAGALLRNPFETRLQELAPGARVVEPAAHPAEGAALLARKLI